MYLTPFKIYLAVWLPGLFASAIFENDLISDISGFTTALVLAPALIYILFGLTSKAERVRSAPYQGARTQNPLQRVVNQIDERKAQNVLGIIVWAWLFLYVIMIISSGGLPLFWVLTGDPRTYVDFGVPTLGGLCNMLRAFSSALACLLLAHHDVSRFAKRRMALLLAVLLSTAFVLETGRGNGVVLALHPIAFFFLGRRLKPATLFRLAILIPVCLLCLGYIQHVRYGSDWQQTEGYAVNQGFSVSDSRLLTLMVPAVTYITSPIQNLNLQVADAKAFSLSPYHSVAGLLPTIIRDQLFESKDYGDLVSEANNVTSSYTPLVRDFGVIGAGIAALAISTIIGWTWLQATRGRLFYAMLWPALFMALTLSFFSLFLTSLVVVMYAPLAWIVAVAIRKRVGSLN